MRPSTSEPTPALALFQRLGFVQSSSSPYRTTFGDLPDSSRLITKTLSVKGIRCIHIHH